MLQLQIHSLQLILFDVLRVPSCVSARTRAACLVCAVLVFGAARPALGNDGYGELGLGGIVTLGKAYAVSMSKEVLEISPNKIRVDYVFERNSSEKNLSLPVMLPLPLYGAEAHSLSWSGAP